MNRVDVEFEYRFESNLLATLNGVYKLDYIISNGSGWEHIVELQPETGFTGHTFSAKSVIDFSQVQAIINNLEQQTGVKGQQYTLAVAPHVTVNGVLTEQNFQDTFTPQLRFQLSPLQAHVEKDPSQDNPFTVIQAGSVKQAVQTENTLSFMQSQFNVFTIRIWSVFSLILLGGGLLMMTILMVKDNQTGQTAGAESKYGSMLVDVCGINLAANSLATNSLAANSQTVIKVNTIDDLAKIAKYNNCMMLHQTQGANHHYFVQVKDTLYHYQRVKKSNRPDKHSNPVLNVRAL